MIDPGGPEAVKIAKELLDKGIQIKHILLTHGHFDHSSEAMAVSQLTDESQIYMHKSEKIAYEDFIDAMSLYGLQKTDTREPDVWIGGNQILKISNLEIEVLHVPGHSPGSVVYRYQTPSENSNASKIAFVGDCIFEGSIGRVDLPYSNSSDMLSSLKYLINELQIDTKIFSGHGNSTVMGIELQQNPYLLAIQNNQPIF